MDRLHCALGTMQREKQKEGGGSALFGALWITLTSLSLGSFRMVIQLKVIHLHSLLSSSLKSQGVKLAVTSASLSHGKVLGVCCGPLPEHKRLHWMLKSVLVTLPLKVESNEN